MSIPPWDAPTGVELDAWVQSLAGAGVTMIVLDIGTREGVGPIGDGEPRVLGSRGRVYFRTGWAEVARDVFGELMPVARRHGLSVFAAVSLRRMNWVDPTLGWVDRSYDPARLQLRLSPFLDLFHPAFQEYLIGLLADLADTGIDGVLFRNDASLGPADGFSHFALQGFERDFHVKADPTQLLPRSMSGLVEPPGSAHADRAPGGQTPEFWQWTGWKAREMIKVVDKLKSAMRAHAPALQFALEVHPEAVTDPLAALVRYGEDLLEAKRSGFQFFLVRMGSQHPVSTSFIERMGQLIGDPQRVWVPIVFPLQEFQRPEAWLRPAPDRERNERGVGLIYIAN